MNNDVIIGGLYRHFKGRLCRVIGVGNHSETGEPMVMYKCAENSKVYVRPLDMFLEAVDRPDYKYKGARFEYINNTENGRISKVDYYLKIAKAVSLRSTCLRRHYGCVIVKNDEIVSTGYNGSERNAENCCDVGECYRMRMNIPHGQQYEKCVSVHAEQNAIISASREKLIGSVMYLYGYDCETKSDIVAEPCLICERMIKNAGIEKIININDADDIDAI